MFYVHSVLHFAVFTSYILRITETKTFSKDLLDPQVSWTQKEWALVSSMEMRPWDSCGPRAVHRPRAHRNVAAEAAQRAGRRSRCGSPVTLRPALSFPPIAHTGFEVEVVAFCSCIMKRRGDCIIKSLFLALEYTFFSSSMEHSPRWTTFMGHKTDLNKTYKNINYISMLSEHSRIRLKKSIAERYL